MGSVQVQDVLRKCQVFSRLSGPQLQAVARLGEMEAYEAGDVVYRQGKIGKKLYVLAEGQIGLERRFDMGNGLEGTRTVYVVQEVPRRRLLGGWCTLVGKEHVQMCSATCNGPVRLVSLPCSELRETIREDSALGVKILEELVLILRERIENSYAVMETL